MISISRRGEAEEKCNRLLSMHWLNAFVCQSLKVPPLRFMVNEWVSGGTHWDTITLFCPPEDLRITEAQSLKLTNRGEKENNTLFVITTPFSFSSPPHPLQWTLLAHHKTRITHCARREVFLSSQSGGNVATSTWRRLIDFVTLTYWLTRASLAKAHAKVFRGIVNNWMVGLKKKDLTKLLIECLDIVAGRE